MQTYGQSLRTPGRTVPLAPGLRVLASSVAEVDQRNGNKQKYYRAQLLGPSRMRAVRSRAKLSISLFSVPPSGIEQEVQSDYKFFTQDGLWLKMSSEKHEAVGGRVNLYRRSNSRFWQCQGSFGGVSERASTKAENLDEARRFAENWYLEQEEKHSGTAPELPVSSVAVQADTPGTVAFPQHDKKARLLAAAIALVSEVGFKDAQISAIADRAGLAQGTLYRNYKSRTALLVKVVAHVSQHEVDVVAGIAMGDEPAPDILRRCAYTFGSRAIRGRRMGYALVAEPVESEIEIERLRYRQKLMRVFETVIDRGIREGAFVDQPVQVSSACIVGSLFEALVGPIARVNDTSEADQLAQVEAIADFCVRAVVGTAAC